MTTAYEQFEQTYARYQERYGAGQQKNHRNGAHDDEPETAPERRLFFVPFEDLDTRTLEPMQYLIKPHLVAGEATLLFAPPRNFKSFLAMEWGLSVALGHDLFGRYEAKQGLVLYLDLENPLDRLRERIRASLARDGYMNEDLAGRLLLQDRGPDIPPWRMEGEAIAQLGDIVADFKPALVIVDNFRKALPGMINENKNEEVNPLLNTLLVACERGGAALLLVHHTNKGYEQFSGAGSLESTMANVIKIRREAESAVATVSCVNMRNAEDWEPFGITMGVGNALQLTEPVTASTRLEDALCAILARGGRTIAELAQDSQADEPKVRRAIDGLQAKGLVIEVGTRMTGGKGHPPKVYGLVAD